MDRSFAVMILTQGKESYGPLHKRTHTRYPYILLHYYRLLDIIKDIDSIMLEEPNK